MTFLYPYVLYALFLPAILVIIAWITWKRKSKKWTVLVSPQYKRDLVSVPSTLSRTLPLVFGILALIFCILACARPIDGMKEVKEMPSSRNILIAIDCSRSMLAKDVSPSRLDRAKTAAYDLLDTLPNDKFGIIIFSGQSVLVMPLTFDHTALKDMIDQIQFGWVARGGTNLESVVQLALTTYSRNEESNDTNALVILSDGEDTENVTYQTAEEAKKQNLIIVTAGIGTTSGTMIPNENNQPGFYKDHYGRNIVTKLNPESLQYLAKQTDGQYLQLSDGSSLNNFVKSLANRLTADQGKEEMHSIPNDRFYIFAIPALISLLLTIIVGTRWRTFSMKRSSNAFIWFALGLSICVFGTNSSYADTLKQANDVYESSKDYDAISKAYDQVISDQRTNSKHKAAAEFAKGYSELQAKRTKEASAAFSQSLLTENPQMQADAHYNLGNIAAKRIEQALVANPSATQAQSIEDQIKEVERRMQQVDTAKTYLQEALTHYEDALATEPNHVAAKKNENELKKYDTLLDQYKKQLEEELERLKKQKEEQQKQDQQNKDQQNKDQQNKDQQNKDQQNKDQQNKDQQNKDQQNKDQQNKDQQNKDQQNKDQQNKNQQNQQQGKEPEEDKQIKNVGENKNQEEKMPEEKPRPGEQKTAQPQEAGQLSEAEVRAAKEAKEKKDAKEILFKYRDNEAGCPVPQRIEPYVPEKDY